MAGPAPLTMGSTASRTLDGAGLRLTEARFPADLRLDHHEHDRPSLVVMLAGAMDDELSGRIRPCPPSTVLVEPRGARHANRFGPAGGRVLIVQPSTELAEMPPPVAALFSDVHHAPAPAVARLGWRISDELREPDDVTPMLATGLAQEMIAFVCRADRPPVRAGRPRWLATVEETIHESFARPINLDQLASSVAVHPAHLGRAFRRYRGMPLGEWIRRLRLEHALVRLARSEDPIADIAAASGFADQSHLTRVMHRRIGVTPADYRRLARGS
jgi:AraC family transcriptional regulator